MERMVMGFLFACGDCFWSSSFDPKERAAGEGGEGKGEGEGAEDGSRDFGSQTWPEARGRRHARVTLRSRHSPSSSSPPWSPLPPHPRPLGRRPHSRRCTASRRRSCCGACATRTSATCTPTSAAPTCPSRTTALSSMSACHVGHGAGRGGPLRSHSEVGDEGEEGRRGCGRGRRRRARQGGTRRDTAAVGVASRRSSRSGPARKSSWRP